ncbi:MAG: hypothetical protein KJO43_02195, partial [Phycisphaerae bacterium]|nr:hypothetical protein [Phycisphaerae bacterium]
MSIPFDELWNYDDPAATEGKLREAGAGIDPVGEPDLHVQLQTQIARTLSLRGRFEEAHALLDQVESLFTPAVVVGRIRHQLERGRTFNSAGENAKAIECFREALNRAEDGGH